MVIAPQRTERAVAAFDWSLAAGPSQAIAPRSEAAQALATNAIADALPLFEALASGRNETLAMPLSARLSLQLQLSQG